MINLGRNGMKRLVLPVEHFDFDGFLEATYAFIRDRLHEPDPSVWIQALEPGSDFPDDRGCREVREDLDKGLALFFPFALPDMTGGTFCADGNEFATWQSLESEEGVPEEHEYLVDDINELGFIVSMEGANYVIRTARLCGGLQAGPRPYLEVQENMGIFEDAMADFRDRFVRP